MNLFKRFQKSSVLIDFLDGDLEKTAKELNVKELMIDHAIDLIAKQISKAKFNYYEKGQISNDEVSYTLNVKPNNIQLANSFWSDVARTLLKENEALIIVKNKKLILAESFDIKSSEFNSIEYSNVKYTLDGKSYYSMSASSENAIHLSLGDSDITNVIESFNTEYSEMIQVALKGYLRSNSKKFKLTLPGANTQYEDQDGNKVSVDDYVKTKVLPNILDIEDGVVSLPSSFQLEELNLKETSKTSSDTNDLIKKFGDYVAMMFCIPLDVFYGSQTEKSTGTNDFMTFAVMPIIKIIETGLNAGLISEKDYLNNTRIIANKFSMQYFNIMDISSSIDKLRSVGYSFNDTQTFIDEPTIDEEWANKRFITKNYQDMKFDEQQEGGD
ncbi:phage portal protein [Erysipelothrix anatis]|uniref:phage portal protein n=1 Tax=Erysipelothrix anatis TaxID=2683713 RepID=UPI00135A1F74|nr:phage portal protein [Erysipelothrix anatis]